MNDFQVLWKKVRYYISILEMQIWSNDDRGRKYQVDCGGSHLSRVYRKKEMEAWMEGFLQGCDLRTDQHSFLLDFPQYRKKAIIEGAGFEINNVTEDLLFTVYRDRKLSDSNGYYIDELHKRYSGDMRYEQYRLKRNSQ